MADSDYMDWYLDLLLERLCQYFCIQGVLYQLIGSGCDIKHQSQHYAGY